MQRTQLTQAIALALAALSTGTAPAVHAAATTMYNLSTGGGVDASGNATPCAPCGAGATDGWVWGFDPGLSSGFAPKGATASVAKWAGTAATYTTPFGYNGGGALHWAVQMTGAADTAEISSQDAVNRYGVGADIDTAKGAWSDNSLTGASGWRHDLDYGLFKSNTGGIVTLTVNGVNQTGTNFGFTVFRGMDTSAVAYGHHGGWNKNNNVGGITADSLPSAGLPASQATSFTTGQIVAYSVGGATPKNLNTISFLAMPGQVYTVVLGGYRNGDWWDTTDGYVLKFASADPNAMAAGQTYTIAAADAYTVSSALDLKGTLNNYGKLADNGALDLNGGTLNNYGNLFVSKLLNLKTGKATLTNQTGGNMVVSGGMGILSATATFENFGTASFIPALGGDNASGFDLRAGVIKNHGKWTFDTRNAAQCVNAITTKGTAIANDGRFEVAAGTVCNNNYIAYTQTAGETWVNGTLGGNMVFKGGLLGGNGTLRASAFPNTSNASVRLSPGDPIGTLTLDSPLLFRSASTLEIDLAGNQVGTYDRLVVNGVAEFNLGAIKVTPRNGYKPQVGDHFEIVKSNTGLTMTANPAFTLPKLGAGLKWNVTYTVDSIVLDVL